MTVVPELLPDTTSVAGYDHLDPISQWFLGGSGTCGANATGIVDGDRYGLDVRNSGSGGLSLRATSGNGQNQIKVDNTSVTLSGNVVFDGTPVGLVSPYAGSTAPAGWLLCNGITVSQMTYALLYAAIGSQFTLGGETAGTFRLPDARGRVIIGVSASPVHNLGSTGGAETVDVSHTHSGPSHNHDIDDHGHDLYAHDHGSTGSGTYKVDSTPLITSGVAESGSGGGTDLDTTVNLVHGGSDKVARQGHTHNINDIDLDVAGDSNTGTINSGDANNNQPFESTKNKTGMSTQDDGTGATGSGGSSAQSVMQPFIVMNAIIYYGSTS